MAPCLAGLIVGAIAGLLFLVHAWISAQGEPLSIRQTVLPEAVIAVGGGFRGILTTLGVGRLVRRKARND